MMNGRWRPKNNVDEEGDMMDGELMKTNGRWWTDEGEQYDEEDDKW